MQAERPPPRSPGWADRTLTSREGSCPRLCPGNLSPRWGWRSHVGCVPRAHARGYNLSSLRDWDGGWRSHVGMRSTGSRPWRQPIVPAGLGRWLAIVWEDAFHGLTPVATTYRPCGTGAVAGDRMWGWDYGRFVSPIADDCVGSRWRSGTGPGQHVVTRRVTIGRPSRFIHY